MSREILFRAKCIDNGHSEWVEGNLVYTPENDDDFRYIIIPKHNNGMYTKMPDLGLEKWYKVDPSTVCQYTGFTDEHHKKIFEGDIVGFIDGMSTENGFAEYEQVGLVEWYGSVGAFNVTERLSAESWEVLEDCVVLGNRWDNPELLEGGTDGV